MLRRAGNAIWEATRRYFIAGLLAVAPIAVTLWAVVFLLRTLDGLLPTGLLSWIIPGLENPPLIGALITFGLILLAGFAVRHLFGNELVRLGERLLGRVPVARSIYAGVKQLFEAIFITANTRKSFNRVVLVEYPRKGIYAVAFTTGEAAPVIAAGAGPGAALVNVFVPTTPNPTSGVYILVRPQDVHELDLSVEEAFKVIMSAGIVTPAAHGKAGLDTSLAPGAPGEAGDDLLPRRAVGDE